MPRLRDAIAIAGLLLVAPAASGRAPGDVGPLAPYLEQRGLDEILAVHLADAAESGELSNEDASRLAGAIERLLASESDKERWELVAAELLGRIPETSQTSARLRLSLADAWQQRAWPAVIAALTGEENRNDLAHARRLLRDAADAYALVGRRAVQRVEGLDRKVDQNRSSFVGIDTQEELDLAQRRRSRAFYGAGWCEHLLAVIAQNDDEDPAPFTEQSATRFAWLFDPVRGRPPRVSEIDPETLAAPPVAHAALAMALNRSLEDEHARARQWLTLVESMTKTPEPAASQAFSTRMRVLARAGDWRELADDVESRQPGLTLGEARLLTLLSADAAAAGGEKSAITRCLRTALTTLVEADAGEALIPIARRLGENVFEGDGFLPVYVRGLSAYRLAQDFQSQGRDPGDRYRRSATLLARAADAKDAGAFPRARASAVLRAAEAFAQAGEHAQAVSAAERAAELAIDDSDTRRALEAGIESARAGGEPLVEALRRLTGQYRKRFPGSDYSVGLLLTQDAPIGDAELDELLIVRPGSPVYVPARFQASQVLWERWRDAPPGAKPEAARRYRIVASELLRVEREHYRAGDADAASTVDGLSRQILEVMLLAEPPDTAAARAVLNEHDRDVIERSLEIGGAPGELLFRRLQLALAEGEHDRARELEGELERVGGRFGRAAAGLTYDETVRAWRRDPADTRRAEAVVRTGDRLLGGAPAEGPIEPGLRRVMEDVAAAAFAHWQTSGDLKMRDTARRLDLRSIEAHPPTPGALERLARVEQDRGDAQESLGYWRRLLAASEPGTDRWYLSRYESLRLLARTDRDTAREALEQYRVLAGGWGPEPWGERFQVLARTIEHRSGRAFDGGGGRGGGGR